jgi:hypothetical protein
VDARRRVPDFAAAGILVVLAAVVFWESTRWPAAGGFAGNATLVPHSLALLMVATAIGLALLAGRGMPDEEGRIAAALGGIGATAAMAALLPILGVIVAGSMYLLALQRFVGAPVKSSLISALVAPATLYVVFAKGLNVPLPIGSAWSFLGI